MRVAISGGGGIGACLAYYLSREGAKALLVERHEIAGAPSGKSGGFLGLDWCDGSALAPLARRTFSFMRSSPMLTTIPGAIGVSTPLAPSQT